MKLFISFLVVLMTTVVLGCSSMGTRSVATLTLDKLDKADLAQLNPEEAISFFGKPDIRETVGQAPAQEALVYFNAQDPRSPLLSLIFDSNTNKLISANLFSPEKDREFNFSKIQKRYPKEIFEKPTIVKDGAYGAKLSRYKSSTSPLRVFLRDESDEVSALSWVLVEDSTAPKRRPTSH